MFETDPNIGLQGIAFRNKLIAERNARSAQSFRDAYEGWKSYALDLEGKLGDAQAEIERLKLEVQVQTTTCNNLAEELKRISEIAAEVPQLISALRAQRAIAQKFHDELRK